MIEPHEPADDSVLRWNFLAGRLARPPQSACPHPARRKAFPQVLLPRSLLTTAEKELSQ
jgi:hypothetical protein